MSSRDLKLWKRPDGSHYEAVEAMHDADIEVRYIEGKPGQTEPVKPNGVKK